MRVLRTCLGITAALLVLSTQSALARDLAIATATPQAVACVFTPNCAVAVTDSVGYFRLFSDGGNGRLQVRTYPGMPGTKAAGLTGYSLYLDMRGATALGTANCATTLVLDVGPVAALPYGGTAEIFVVSGSGGSGIASASQSGSKITFRFARPVCPGRDSLYFGFAAKNGPVPGKGVIAGSLGGTADVDVRVPKH